MGELTPAATARPRCGCEKALTNWWGLLEVAGVPELWACLPAVMLASSVNQRGQRLDGCTSQTIEIGTRQVVRHEVNKLRFGKRGGAFGSSGFLDISETEAQDFRDYGLDGLVKVCGERYCIVVANGVCIGQGSHLCFSIGQNRLLATGG